MSSESPTQTGFAGLNLSVPVLKALDAVGYETPSPIQAQMIPHMLAGRDVLGQAQTGTGKTAAFALPILTRIDLKRKQPQALVLAPTRELAIQVAEAFQTYASKLKGFHVLPVYGGQDYRAQLRPLQRGVHVVVGTPGRVMDHMRRGTLKLDALQCLVLDEADEMLRMGFIDDVEWVLEQIPEGGQTALFSATMPTQIRRIARKHLREPAEITIESKTTTVEAIRQRYWEVSPAHKLDAFTRILEAEEFDGMIVFVRTKMATVEVAEKLEARGYAAAPINGDMPQKQREHTIGRLKNGKLDILVATDVAARGLDVERISHVINYDIPYDTEAYTHRIGRTGRAGREGDAILFVAPRERRMLGIIEKATRQKIERLKLPSTEDINDQRIARFKQRISDTLAAEDMGICQNIVEQYQAEHNIPAIEIAAALAKLLQGDEPLLLKEQPAPRGKKEHRKGSRADRQEPGHDRPRRELPPREAAEEGMVRYRLEVGHDHQVKPGNIVGAIANETGLDSQYIGRIDIQGDHSFVDLPEGMPKEIFQHLKKTYVAGQALRISKADGGDRRGKPAERKPPRHESPRRDNDRHDFKAKDRSDRHGDKHKPARKPRHAGQQRELSPGTEAGADRREQGQRPHRARQEEGASREAPRKPRHAGREGGFEPVPARRPRRGAPQEQAAPATDAGPGKRKKPKKAKPAKAAKKTRVKDRKRAKPRPGKKPARGKPA